ncbi:biliverdin-producing heme oxygenase [Sphingomonas sp. RS2018]
MSGARGLLRSATAAAHERVDAAFGAADLGSRTGYAAFLAAQASAHLPVEAALEAAGAARVLADWPTRRRTEALIADLADLGEPLPPAIDPPMFDTPARMLGAIYVLEGSRLGGAMLKRSVAPGLPTRFLGSAVPGGWRALIEFLDQMLATEQESNQATEAALAVFDRFERAGLNFLKARPL